MTSALVLSGGGAKGSFELGALQYLYKYNFRPDIICSTSVGSVNGLKLTEGEGAANQGFQGLQQIWLNMNSNDSMFQEEQWFQDTPDWIKSAVGGITGSGGGGGSLEPDLFETIVLLFVPIVAASQLNDIGNFVKAVTSNKSFYNLEPIHQLAINNINLTQVANSNIKLRMATVSLEGNVVRYITEKGRLLTDPAAPSDDPSSPQVDIFTGMIASASIPLAFEPQKLNGEWYVDGGVDAIVPLQAAVALGATFIYTIVCTAKLQAQLPGSFDGAGIPDIINRTTDVMTDRITDYNLSEPHSAATIVLPVRATYEIESSRTIDPGLIRINSAYGYMRAFDMLEQYTTASRASLIDTSEEIGSIRKAIWDQENEIYDACSGLNTSSAVPSGGVGVTRDQGVQILQQLTTTITQGYTALRLLKNSLQGLVLCRENVAGADSLPPEQWETWNLQWEAHQNDMTSLPGSVASTPSPWGSVTINPNLHGGETDTPGGPWSITGPALVVPSAVPQVTPYALCAKALSRHSTPSGNYLQSDYGNVGNFEVVVIQGESINHYARNNDNSSMPWSYLRELPNPWKGATPPSSVGGLSPPSGPIAVDPAAAAAVSSMLAANTVTGVNSGVATGSFSSTANPGWNLAEHPAHFVPDSVCFFQSNYKTVPTNGDFEAIVHFKADNATDDFLAAYWYGAADNQWHGPFPITVNGNTISGVTGKPAFIQSNWGGVGNFEMLVPQGDAIKHYGRFNDDPSMPWVYLSDLPMPTFAGITGASGIPTTTTTTNSSGSVTSAIGGSAGLTATGTLTTGVVRPPPPIQLATYLPASVSMVQSGFPHQLFPWGKFEAVVHFVSNSSSPNDDYLAEYEFDFRTNTWSGPSEILVNGSRITGVVGNPVVIQSDFGSNGNFELLACQQGTIKHYARNNDDPATPWAFLRDVIGVAGQGAAGSNSSAGTGSGGGIPPPGGLINVGVGVRPPPGLSILSPTSVSFFQSNYKTVPTNGNFEALVQLTGSAGGSSSNDYLTTYWYGAADNRWHDPIDVILSGQQKISGVTPF